MRKNFPWRPSTNVIFLKKEGETRPVEQSSSLARKALPVRPLTPASLCKPLQNRPTPSATAQTDPGGLLFGRKTENCNHCTGEKRGEARPVEPNYRTSPEEHPFEMPDKKQGSPAAQSSGCGQNEGSILFGPDQFRMRKKRYRISESEYRQIQSRREPAVRLH